MDPGERPDTVSSTLRWILNLSLTLRGRSRHDKVHLLWFLQEACPVDAIVESE
jgi:hypothetical protein